MYKIDHTQLALDRLATEYSDSTNLHNLLRVLLQEADTLEQVICDVIDKRWLDTATGINLDILGSIVGIGRGFVDAGAGVRLWTDEEYQLLIKAQIAKNHTTATIQEVLDATIFITGTQDIIIRDGYTFFTISVPEDIPSELKYFLLNFDLIPRPAGVALGFGVHDPINGNFAYEGHVNAQPYDLGVYASILK